jgi:hypothetical protein
MSRTVLRVFDGAALYRAALVVGEQLLHWDPEHVCDRLSCRQPGPTAAL